MKKSGIKATIEHIVRLFDLLGVTCLTPETLRQAKFNGPAVVSALELGRHPFVHLDPLSEGY
jgi:hypothetical protein